MDEEGSEDMILQDTLDKMYGKWDVPVTPEGLTACIEEFCEVGEK